jgi:hypothetical protein
MKGKCEPAHAMKAYRRNGCRDSLIFNLDTRRFNDQPQAPDALPPGERAPVRTE